MPEWWESRRVCRIAGVSILGLALMWAAADAQQRFDFVGAVQWVSADRLQLWTASGPVNVDVSRVDQSAYAGLRAGDVVRVVGYLAPDRIRVVAEMVEPNGWTQAP